MEKNCLFKKFNAESEDTSLPILGASVIKRILLDNEGTNNARAAFQIANNKSIMSAPLSLKIEGEGEFFSDSARTNSLGDEITIPANTSAVTYYTSNGNYDIVVSPKYVGLIYAMNLAYIADIKDTFYMPITYIEGRGWKGNVRDLNPDRITQINQISSDDDVAYVTGSITDLAKLTNLTKVICPKLTKGAFADLGTLVLLTGDNRIPVYGSIESFVRAQRANGRTTNSTGINFKWLATTDLSVTFNGNNITLVENNNISWTSTTITYNGTTIDA